ncbi:SURF1 family protein [Paenarthrobacter ureafaciens]|uniref:SURF1 family protein n=1 Tax=Paenarthrobacter ureafaciens TaxID=37931 RepID=UPI0019170907|nr:SURF1 family protein [Paenarthrobacter ureafaciens]QQQ61421.1 SURF1 family protein [Paenarthrobacter ureafaciens]UOD80160.1 SURF1 family protein [Paenarthrobacter ureafaciens]WNZ04496.1 SURF1 family protein [Paenarthrobacter ureafaciens]
MLKTALKPRWIAGLVFALLLSGVFVLLSQWQLSRSAQHEPATPSSIEEVKPLVDVLKPGQFFPGSVEDQMVTATGSYDPGKQVLVEGRLYDNRKGYWIITAFAVDNAPKLSGAAASPQTWIPVARGWVAEPDQAGPPPSGPLTLTGRLLASEAPLPNVDAGPGRASAVSVAELINKWDVSSYPGFVAVTAESTPTGPVPANEAVKALNIPAQPPATQINWLNLFYSVEWVVFAGFALYIWWRMVADDYRRDLEGDEFDGDDFDDDFDDGGPRHNGEAHHSDEPAVQESQHSEPEHKVQP